MDKTAEKFATYASELSYSDLTPAAIHAVKRSVIDSIGCVYGTYFAEPVKIFRNLAARTSATHPATILGTAIRSSPEWAAFANAAMIRYSDFSDDYFGAKGDSGPHPSDNIASILAAAETTRSNGKDLILGIAIAYEACGQIVDQCPLHARGWDYSVFHAIATSLGTGRVLGLSRDQMRNALAMAVVPGICLLQTRLGELSNWKGLAGPNASRNGYFAAMLAKEGITGPAEPFEGKAGFMHQLNNPFELGDFGGKGVAFKVEGTFLKYFPVAYSSQLPIWTALELRDKVELDDIEDIVVHLVKRYAVTQAERPHYWDPKTRETADHSSPYLIASALTDGDVTLRTLTPERFRDPAILALVRKIRLHGDEQFTAAFPGVFNCRIEATLKSGTTISVHQTNPKGHPANPMADSEVDKKFLKQTEAVLTVKQSRALLDQLWELEKLEDLTSLYSLMLVTNRE